MDQAARRRWLGVLAKAKPAELEGAFAASGETFLCQRGNGFPFGVAGGWVPGAGGEGTSILGGRPGSSGGASLGRPGGEGWGSTGSVGWPGSSGNGGSCCIV